MADRRRAIAAALPVSRELAAPAPMVGIRKKVSEPIVSRLVALADGFAILGSGLVVVETSAWRGDWRLLGVFVLLGTILAVNFLHLAGAYRFARFASLESAITRVLAGGFATFATLFLATHIFEPAATAAGSWTAAWLSAGLAALMTIRLVLHRQMERWATQGRLGELVAVVGAGPIAQRLLRSLHAAELPSLRVIGVYDDDADRLPTHCMGYPILGTMDALIADARRLGIGTIMVALPLHADRMLVDTLNRLSLIPADVRLCPDEFGLRLGNFEVSHLGGLTFLNVIDRPLRDWKWIAKTVEDRVLGALILLLISPLLALVAVLIKLDSPGPVFFRQKRYGFNNELIEVLKFRTMYVGETDANAEQLTRRGDPRITPIGRFLRRTSIDELPQFINVLRGEMSIVGPRPHALRAKAGTLLYQEAVKYYDARHRMKPGITGWAQVNGWRGETDTVEQIRKRVEHDLYYIEHWSIALDLKIIVRTILGGFTGAHAF